MTERPIIFNDAMVRAVLSGAKTQTRRMVKPRNAAERDVFARPNFQGIRVEGRVAWGCTAGLELGWRMPCVTGDRLWVRECWGVGSRPDPVKGWRDGIEYRAGGEDGALWPVTPPKGVELDRYESSGWRPSIHMPRWASRLTLDVVSVRVERVQDISEADARAEGIVALPGNGPNRWTVDVGEWSFSAPTAREVFAMLWSDIYGAESWDVNPWVWAVEFKRVEAGR